MYVWFFEFLAHVQKANLFAQTAGTIIRSSSIHGMLAGRPSWPPCQSNYLRFISGCILLDGHDGRQEGPPRMQEDRIIVSAERRYKNPIVLFTNGREDPP